MKHFFEAFFADTDHDAHLETKVNQHDITCLFRLRIN